MSRQILACILLFILLSSISVKAGERIPIRTVVMEEGIFRYVENELLVGFKEDVDIYSMRNLASRHRGNIKTSYRNSFLNHGVIKFEEGVDITSVRRLLESDENIEYVNYNYIGTFCEYIVADELYPQQWALRKIKACDHIRMVIRML